MELFGIVLSAPAALVCTLLYAWILGTFVRSRESLRHAIRATSIVILGLIVLEVVLLSLVGATQLRRALGPVFYAIHLVLFFAAVPSLANVLLLTRTQRGRWHVLAVGCACAAFSLPTVLMQYAVSEAIFGVG